jgi:hypothetical protein
MRNIPPMAIPPHDPGAREQANEAAAIRDAAVRRVRSATRWLAAGAIALTGVIAGVVAQHNVPAKASTAGGGAASGSAGRAAQAQEEGAVNGESGAASGDEGSSSGYDDGSGSTGEGGYDDGGQYSGAPQAPQQAPQSAPQSVTPSASSGAS